MSSEIQNSINGFIYDLKILGNTQRFCGGNLKSVGKLFLDANGKPILNTFGQEQYKFTIRSYNAEKTQSHNIDFYLPCQLQSVAGVRDTLYWDEKREEWCVIKRVGFNDELGEFLYTTEKIIRTGILSQSELLLRTYEGGTIIELVTDIEGIIECKIPCDYTSAIQSVVSQFTGIKKELDYFNNKIPHINNEIYKLKMTNFNFDDFVEFDTWARENEDERISKMTEIEDDSKEVITDLNTTKTTFSNILNEKIEEVNRNLVYNDIAIGNKINNIQEQLDTKTSAKFTELDGKVNGKINEVNDAKETLEDAIELFTTQETNRQNNETIRQTQETSRQNSISTMTTNVNNKITEVNNKITEVNTSKNSMVTDVNNKITEVNNKLASVDSRVNQAIASGTVDLEVKDARVGQDGTSYTCLKDRLNAIEIKPYILYEDVEG